MVISKMSGLFKSAYEPKNLLKTNVAASGILLLLGDIIQQNIELYRGVHEKGEERTVTKTSACNDDISLDPNTFTSLLLHDNLCARSDSSILKYWMVNGDRSIFEEHNTRKLRPPSQLSDVGHRSLPWCP